MCVRNEPLIARGSVITTVLSLSSDRSYTLADNREAKWISEVSRHEIFKTSYREKSSTIHFAAQSRRIVGCGSAGDIYILLIRCFPASALSVNKNEIVINLIFLAEATDVTFEPIF